jgi:hypothetical protein
VMYFAFTSCCGMASWSFSMTCIISDRLKGSFAPECR